MNLADRLRSVVRPSGAGGPEGPPLPQSITSPDSRGAPSGAPDDWAADLLGGEYHEYRGHRYMVIDRKYSPGYRHGHVAIVDSAPDSSGSWPTLRILVPEAVGRVVFIDLETTGLSGGAGTYAFLVGCGWFDGPTFRIRQFLLAGYGAERGLLEAVGEIAGGAGAIATYNGKTFDLPIIDTRFVLHRLATPFEAIPHIDLLHPARRLWGSGGLAARADSPDPSNARSCRLAAVEAAVLGHVREGDVPGFEIPSRYFHYVRSGDPRPLAAVLEHNRLDLLSLALLTGRVAQLLELGAGAAATVREALGLGRLYQRAGMLREARACFGRAADAAAAPDDGDEALARAEALHTYAVLCRRAREHDEAARMWQRVLETPGCPPALARDAREALAVHYEHRLRDFRAARRLAVESLRFGASATRVEAIHHRVARLDRKLASPLF